MILRPFSAAGDASRLSTFTCSTGEPFEDDVQHWIRTTSLSWINDIPRATFQRRVLAVIDDDVGSIVAVAAWQDITRVDLQGIWLHVLAVASNHQHSGKGTRVHNLVVERLQASERDGNDLAGLVHPLNHRSKRLLSNVGWTHVADLDDHELWVGRL